MLAAVLGAAAPAGARVPAGFIGMLADGPVFDSHVDLQRELLRMRAAGVQMVRTPFYGDRVQPDPELPITLGRTDRFVLAAARARLRVLPVVLSVPPWARQTPSVQFSAPTAGAGRAFYVSYVQALVRRYGPRGTLWDEHPGVRPVPVRRWQLWNEPEGLRFWHEPPRLKQYVALLRRATPAIHALDPGAQVVLGGIVSDSRRNLQRVYDLGGRRFFDQAAVHPFTFGVPNVLRLARRTRRVMDRNGDRRKPLALTEVAWPTAYKRVPPERAFGFEVTPKEQALKVKRVFRVLARNRKALRLSTVDWASWMSVDRGEYPFDYSGLRRLTRRHRIVNKPGFYAFRAIARLLLR